MKQYIRDILIVLCTITGMTYLYRTWVRRKGPLVRVLVFHDVTDRAWFETLLDILRESYHVLTPDDFVNKVYVSDRINVLITFDDGYASWTQEILPVLNQYGMKAVFFINSGLIDAYGDTERVQAYVREGLLLSRHRETLSWDGVRMLKEAGHTIGGHSTTHARFAELQESMEQESIENDKERIETMLGNTLTLFAYPFGNRGDFTERSEAAVQRAGYRVAFSTYPRFVTGGEYATPRVCIPDALSPRALRHWVGGAYDIVDVIKNICVR